MLMVGKRLCILGDWDSSTVPEGRTPLRLKPGYVFGTGTHPTTFAFLESLESLILDKAIVLDVGCGSGILSIACAKLGAQEVYGEDISQSAVDLARENILMNQVDKIVQISRGTYLPKELPAGYMVDLVLCNIDSGEVLKDVISYSKEVLFLGGRLLLSYCPDSFPLEEFSVGYRIQSFKDLPGPNGGWRLVVLEWTDA